MRSLINLVGLILIIIGLGSLAYNGFTYTQRQKVAEVGNIQLTADTERTVYISPAMGGVTLVIGIVLLLIGRAGGKP